MTHELESYLADIRDSLDRIERYTVIRRAEFLADEKTQDAVIYDLAIIGEAVKRIPESVRAAHPSIPWKKIAGMRDIVIHDYNSTEVAMIWRTVERDLPRLRRTVERMLKTDAMHRLSKAA